MMLIVNHRGILVYRESRRIKRERSLEWPERHQDAVTPEHQEKVQDVSFV
jgi:hypothetical protein